MRIYLFSFWFLPDNRTAVNRIKYFKKKFIEAEVDVQMIFCDDSISMPHQNELFYKLPHVHFFYKLSRFLLKKHWYMLYKIVHFLYIITQKRDVYDFYRNFRAAESQKAFKYGKNDVVITSAPPYSALNIGCYLKRKYGVKWIIDYRDPWTLGYPTLGFSNFADKLRRFTQRKEELKFLDAADYVITVSESLKNLFPEKYHHKIKVIPNGANTDEMDLSKINPRPTTFSIVYAGTVHPQQLENVYFFEVVKKFIVDHHILPEDFKIHFVGSLDSTELKEEVHKYHLQEYVNITPRVDLSVLYDFMYDASMFLHLKYANRDKIITSKNYDYLALQKPILLPSSDHGDLHQSIEENNAGYVCNTKEQLYDVLKTEYAKFMNNEDVCIYRDQQFIKSISRNTASDKLLELIFTESVFNSTITVNTDLVKA